MKRAKTDEELLTVAEVSQESGISRDGVRAAIRAQRLPAIQKSKRLYLVRRADLNGWKPRGWKPKPTE